MNLQLLKPKKALNKAFLKIKPIRSEIEAFKESLTDLLDNSNDIESEEFHKNLVADFLKRTYYDPNYFINTKGRNDLVIHNGNKAKSSVGVIIEAKKPTNTGEMVSVERTNTKAMQELVLYYLRERITGKNLEVKKLIITNIYEWFIFDANDFEQHVAQNKALVKQFEDFENGSLSGTSTDFFYKEIAAPAIAAIKEELDCTYFDFRNYEKPLRNTDLKDDVKLVALFKLLSPEHLLKKPFNNDSNSLDKKFYSELLHIIGLSEQKQGGKKIIERNPPTERNTGSLLEDAIIQIDSMDKLSRLDKPSQFGKTQEERLFNVGLELAITWINRVLFLKLLEAQLISYHEGDKEYAFLNYECIGSYDDLNSLFFQVLAKKHEERNADVRKAFENVPYLNSSLFEPTEIEHNALFISNLRDDKTLPILDRTVLKDAKGKRRTGEITTLQYLFDFLNAYDFSGEGSENIQEDNKTLINASVLGLIFEKINGYKDGSFFTPGFITMYMCRETIRKAVVQKFNEASLENAELTRPKVEKPLPLESLSRKEQFGRDKEGGKYDSITDIYNAIGSRGDFSHLEANELINDIKICDPAVGSGHFLVSALNEMIAVKHDLGVLHDREGKLLRDYDVHVENDELIITDNNGELFDYHPNNRESQRVQETLFHEKQSIIENCLFGVDINANSVKICRLRLWIELLKNAYYKNDTSATLSGRSHNTLSGRSHNTLSGRSHNTLSGRSIETLPNIDINIKFGNSLISRFDLDADLGVALRKSKWNMDSYRIAVQTYRNAENKEQKHEMERLIADIKGDFKTEISRNSKEQRAYDRESAKLYEKHTAPKLFEETLSKSAKSKLKKEREKLEAKVIKLKGQLDEIKDNKIYENAFEWRFEFPEVLDDDGGFVGFDVVIGNPPYKMIQPNNTSKNSLEYYKNTFPVTDFKIDLFHLFYQIGTFILKDQGELCFITPSTILNNVYASRLRSFIISNFEIQVIAVTENKIFEEADVHTGIFHFTKRLQKDKDYSINLSTDLENVINRTKDFRKIRNTDFYKNDNWNILIDEENVSIFKKLNSYIQLNEIAKINRGLISGNRSKYFSKTKDSEKYIKILTGADVKRYDYQDPSEFVLFERPKSAGGSWDSKIHLAPFKVCIRQIGSSPTATLINQPFAVTGNIFTVVHEEKDMLKFILGIINSSLIKYFWRTAFYDFKTTFPQVTIKSLNSIPIALANKQVKKEIIESVNAILELKEQNNKENTIELESQIDQLVYELYDLTEEEITIVEAVLDE